MRAVIEREDARMKKRLLSIAMALCMALGLLPAEARAEEAAQGTFGRNVTWTLDGEGTLTVGGTGPMSYYSDNPLEPYKARIRKAVIENGVTFIEYQAFDGCENLNSVTIGDGVITIGKEAFRGCENLSSVTIGNGVKTIDMHAFLDCRSLQTIAIPSNVTSIDVSAFFGCVSLTSILVSEDNADYAVCGDGALYSKDLTVLLLAPGGLTGTFAVPNGVREIGGSAFYAQQNLSEVILPDGVTKIGTGAFHFSKIERIQIPSSVTEIGNSAFMYCDNLTKIRIPASVASIGSSAFYASSSSQRREICFLGGAPAFGKNCFNNSSFTAYYPSDNPSWTEDVMLDYGGKVDWTPWKPGAKEVLAVWTAGSRKSSVSVFDPEGLLRDGAAVYAAAYSGGQMTEVLPGRLSGEEFVFNGKLEAGWKLLFLEPKSLEPVCGAVVL